MPASTKVSLARSINEVLAPQLKERGFSIWDIDEEARTWKEGRIFRRTRDGRGETILIGRDKFGKALGFTVARQRQDGSYAYMDWHNRGLTRDRLRYRNTDELNEVLGFLVKYFDDQVAAWLESL